MGIFDWLTKPAQEDFGDLPAQAPPPGDPVDPYDAFLEQWNPGHLARRAAWKEYDRRRAELIAGLMANKPEAEYNIQRGLDGVWRVAKWQIMPDLADYMYREIIDPGEPKPHAGYRKLNDLEFKFQEEAERWLHEYLHPEERTFQYDAAGKLIGPQRQESKA